MDEFQRDIPPALLFTELTLRWVVSVLPFLMPLEMTSARQRNALVVFGVGAALYGSRWIALIVVPDSGWAASAVGAVAPAYTPLIWLTAIAVLGHRLYWGRFYRWWMYLLPVVGFLATHIAHAAIVYARTY